MRFDERVVTQIPLEELWNDEGLIDAVKVGDLDTTAVRERLKQFNLQFVVADVGDRLNWVPADDRYDFWKTEARHRIADPLRQIHVEEFRDEYCYWASEWKCGSTETIILLEKVH